MTILRPIFGRGVAHRRLGAEVPELHQKFPILLGAPVVHSALKPPVAKIKNCLEILKRVANQNDGLHRS